MSERPAQAARQVKGKTMRVIRDVFRRKGRSVLTICGITIGVLALVVMGAMAEKITKLVDGGVEYYNGKVSIEDASAATNFGVGMLDVQRARDIRAVDGVAAASGSVTVLYEDEADGINMGMPAMLSGSDFDSASEDLETFTLTAAQGRLLNKDDTGVVVMGNDLAESEGVTVGDSLEIRGATYEVVGVLEKTLSMPDSMAYVSLAEAQDAFILTLPEAMRDSVIAGDVFTEIVAFPETDVDPDKLADTINSEVDGVTAAGPTEFVETVKKSTAIFNAIILGIGLISLMVGGLSVVNTMMMSVSERVREIGIRKAIGASTGSIVRQFLGEAGVIGLVGGLVGLAIGAVIVALGNSAGVESGNILFLLTPRLAIGAVTFATVLGVLSGLYPALHAARLDPVVAFRRG